MSCNLEQALAKVEKLLKFSAIQKNIPFEIKRIKFEIEAMMAAKDKMLNGPEEVLGTSENIKIDHGTDYSKLIASLENRVKDYTKYVTKDDKNINVHRSRKVDNKTEYLPFGNPFSRWSTGEYNDDILSAMFYRWVVNNEVPASYLSEESAEVKVKRLGGINAARINIIKKLENIANKELYYEGTARDKNLSHASVLALIADLYNKGTLTIDINSKQNVLKSSGVEVRPSKETTYEVSSKGDKDYSALYAKLEDGRSIEEHYQVDVKGYKDIASGKNRPPKDTSKNLQEEYTKLWKRYFELYPDRFEFIKEKVDSGIKLTDQFAKSNSVNQADTIMDIVKSKWKPKDNKVYKKDQTIKTTSDTSAIDKETPKVEEKEVNELDNSKIKLSNTKDKDGMWVTSNIPIIMYNTNTKNVSKDNKAVVNTVVSSVSRLAGVTWNNEAAVDKLSYVKENSDDKKLQSLLDTVLDIDKELSNKIDSFDLSKRGNSTYSIDSLNDLVYDMADNYERLHNAQEAVFNHLSSEYGVAVTANHKESENINTGSTTKLFFEQFVPDYMLSKEKTEPKKETPKAAAGKSGIEGLKSQQGDAAVNSKEDLDKYTVNGAELAIDEYLSTDLTPEASTKYENSIIQNNEPKTKHTEIRDDIKKCLLKIGSK